MQTLQVKVKPRARESSLEKLTHGTWIARLKSPPVDGKANDELVALVAEKLGVTKSRVAIKCGASARLKLVQVTRQSGAPHVRAHARRILTGSSLPESAVTRVA